MFVRFKYRLLLAIIVFELRFFIIYQELNRINHTSPGVKSRVASRRSRGLRWSTKVLQSAACAHALSPYARGECDEPQKASPSSASRGVAVVVTALQAA